MPNTNTSFNQLEALLLGQSGLLEGEFQEDYPKLLQREYRFIAKKHNKVPVHKAPDFLRMRPANFPTVRLAQLAALVQRSTFVFKNTGDKKDVGPLRKLLNVTANDYWHYHYHFDESLEYKPKNLGHSMTDNIIINTIVPVLFVYGMAHNACSGKSWLCSTFTTLTGAEQHNQSLEKVKIVANDNALDSQALLELKQHYCDQKAVLQCAIGNKLLKE